jgi:phosphoribosyl 1,2-cyclic phosphodiesterase
MDLFFRSFRSSSAGNCLALWTRDSAVLIDCGVKTLRDCRALLGRHQDAHGPVHGVLVSHAHGDHLSRDGFRVLQEHGIPIHSHPHVVAQLRARLGEEAADIPAIQAFPDDCFTVGDFDITTVPLPHAPGVPNFGFVICAGHGSKRRKVVVCTDFNDSSGIVPHLAGADFVFVEANHDIDMLRRRFNPASRYHLNNAQTASLLCDAAHGAHFAPRSVVLGHLSEERNLERLALGEVARVFAARGMKVPFTLETAPKFESSRVIRVA